MKDLTTMSPTEKRQEALNHLAKIEQQDTPMAAAFRKQRDRVRYIISKAEEGNNEMWAVEYLLKSGLKASLLAFITGATTD